MAKRKTFFVTTDVFDKALSPAAIAVYSPTYHATQRKAQPAETDCALKKKRLNLPNLAG